MSVGNFINMGAFEVDWHHNPDVLFLIHTAQHPDGVRDKDKMYRLIQTLQRFPLQPPPIWMSGPQPSTTCHYRRQYLEHR